jgi:hypothetical protein
MIDSYILERRNIDINIFEKFLLFLILYLFYNANLFDIYNNIKVRVNAISFVDNINILKYIILIEHNYRVLN